jgi:FkbM family methyltransferase
MSLRETFLWNCLRKCFHFFRNQNNRVREILAEKLFSSYVIEKDLEGYSFKFTINDRCAKEWYDDSRISTKETDFIKNYLLKENDIAVDCGAHHGLISILSSKIVGDKGKVYSFEAIPRNVIAIKKNIHINKLNNVNIECLAVSAKNSRINIIDDSNGYISKLNNSANFIEVDSISLDSYFHQKEKPNFIKIDVEGHELQVMKGALKILNTLPNFAIEFHCSTFEMPEQAIQEFKEIIDFTKYDIFVQLDIDGPIFDYNPTFHTSNFLSKYNNLHFFGKS